MPVLSEIRARVSRIDQAQEFFGQAFGWDFQPSQPDGARATAVRPSRSWPPVTLVFTDDPREPPVRLGFTVSDITQAAGQLERLGGQVERRDEREVRGLDSQRTPLLLHPQVTGLGLTGREPRGALGVIFLFADSPEQAATFYHGIAGWNFDPIGGDRDILFVHNGPLVGIRAAGQAPGGQGGTVQFHISVPGQQPAIEAIHDLGGRAGQERAAGIFRTRACTDDQDTAFSLWYQPTPTPDR